MSIINTLVSSTVTSRVYLSGGNTAVTTMFFCNNSNTATAVTIYLVPNALPVSTSTVIINSLPLPSTETFVFDAEKIILGPGDSIYAQATVNNVVVATVSYVTF
jgi:hypothetical protein